MYRNGIQSYRKTNVVTADPGRLVIMCYEGAIEQLKVSKQKIIAQDFEGQSKNIMKAQDIINELLCSLDLEKGGVIARNLESLYNYMIRRIIHVAANYDLDAIDEVVAMLQELLSAWEEVAAKPAGKIQAEAVDANENGRLQASGM